MAERSRTARVKPARRRERTAVINVGQFAFTKKGVSNYAWDDPYRLAISLSWRQFLISYCLIYVSVTSIFAFLYFIIAGSVANARPHSFVDHFFFSLETLATVGYGEMYPATIYGHTVAAVEILTGVAFTAILTGLTFVRFSRPRPKFVFADHPVVTTHNGRSVLMMRVGNGQAAVLADARCNISVLVSEVSKEGASFRRTYELKLVRPTIPVFPLTWTIMHEIDEQSALHGLDAGSFAAADVRIFVGFEARDPALATVVHDVRSYTPVDVLFGMHYTDIILNDENGVPCVDISRVSEVEPDQA